MNEFQYQLMKKLSESGIPNAIKEDLLSDLALIAALGEEVRKLKEKHPEQVNDYGEINLVTLLFISIKMTRLRMFMEAPNEKK